MVYFYDRKFIDCYLEGTTLFIEYEFSEAGQMDGHGPWHGDWKRDWAECVIRNIDPRPVAEVFKKNNIFGIKNINYYNVDISKYEPGEYGLPVHRMILSISFVPEEDTHLSLAQQIINSVKWEPLNEAIQTGRSYSGDWEFGRTGKK